LKHSQESPRNPREIEPMIPEAIARAILRCLEKDPANRFQSVEELQSALLDDAVLHKDRQTIWKNVRSDLRGLVTALRKRPPAVLAATAGYFVLGVVLVTAGVALHHGLTPQPMSGVEKTLSPPVAPVGNVNQNEPSTTVAASTEAIGISTGEVSSTPVVASTDKTTLSARFSRFFNTVAVPDGVFMMGNDNGKNDERPQHLVKLKKFRMSRSEVTNRQYLAFLEDSGYRRPPDPMFAKNYLVRYPDLPVVNVSYGDAVEFCKWATKKFGLLVRIPTEAEWEYAARGGIKDNLYPWGMGSPLTHARYRRNAPRGITTVERTAFAPNGYGLYNLSGNVSEWIADFYAKDYYKISAIKDPRGPRIGSKRVVRGGSWADDEPDLTVTRRSSRDPAERRDDLGFRIVVGGAVNRSREPILSSIADARTKTQTSARQW